MTDPPDVLDHNPRDSFTLDPRFLDPYRDAQPEWGPLGAVVFARTYPVFDHATGRYETPCDVFARVTETVMGLHREAALAADQHWSDEKAQRDAQRIFRHQWRGLVTPAGRGIANLGTRAMVAKGAACLNNPLHEDTRILTREHGWTRLGDIAGERVTVLSSTHDYGAHAPETGAERAAPVWVPATISEREEHPCLELRMEDRHGNVTTVVSSRNHRWFRRRHKTEWARVSTEDLRVGDYLPIVMPSSLYKLSPVAVLHGLFFGDGTRSNGELHLFGPKAVAAEALLSAAAFDRTAREDERVLRQCPLAWAAIPEGAYRSDRRYLAGFLAGYIAADGSVDQKGNVRISSARETELRAVAELFRELGVRCSDPVEVIAEGTPNNFVEHRSALFAIRLTALDLRAEFFVREDQRQRWADNLGRTSRDWAKLTGIRRLEGTHPVLCATVPGYEQFVIEGFVLTSNCGFHTTAGLARDAARPFAFVMDNLMLGVGVGFDVDGAREGVRLVLPSRGAPLVVPDTREGWVDAAAHIFRAYFHGEPLPAFFDTSRIRRKGEPLRTFGGVSSGPGPLIDLLAALDHLCARYVRESRAVDAAFIVDAMNYTGRCVVAGGVRRSSEIALGDLGDADFEALKDPSALAPLYAAQAEADAANARTTAALAALREVRTLQAALSPLSSEWAALEDRADAVNRDLTAARAADNAWSAAQRAIDAHPLITHRWASNNSLRARVGDDYDRIAHRMEANGEPGLTWPDLVRRFGRMADGDLSAPRHAGEGFIPGLRPDTAHGVNPCQPAEALVLTPEGVRTFGEIEVGSVVWSGSRWTRVIRKVVTGVKPVNLYRTSAGAFLGTAEHRVLCRGEKVPVGEVDAIDRSLGGLEPGGALDPQDVMDGLLLGDGGWHGASGRNFLHQGERDDCYDTSEVSHLLGDRREYSGKVLRCITSTITEPLPRTYEREVPARFLRGDGPKVRGFLRGLYAANGSVVANRVTLKAASRAVIDAVQAMLSALGIGSYVTTNAAHPVRFENGEYLCRESYDLNIGAASGRARFRDLVGFMHPHKAAKLDATLSDVSSRPARETFDVHAVEFRGEMPVFDITVEADEHTYWSAGLLVSNCGEQALESGELCNLVETYPSRADSAEEWRAALRTAYMIGKAVSMVPCHDPVTDAIVKRNRRMGISTTGVAEWREKIGHAAMREALDTGYRDLRRVDRLYSGWYGIPESIRLTTVKPSGCRPADALTTTSAGILTLEEMFEAHPVGETWAEVPAGLDALQGAGCDRVTKTYDNGVAEVFRTTLSYGLAVESTANHRWWVASRVDRNTTPRTKPVNAWVATEDLRPGDVLEVRLGTYTQTASAPLARADALSIRMRGDAAVIRQPSRMTPDLAWLLGYLWGDGAMCPARYRLRFTDANVSNLEKAARIVGEVFGLAVSPRATAGEVAQELTIASKHLWHWLIRNGVWKYHADRIDVIPRVVRSSSREDVLAFLAGLLDSDGCAVIASSGGKLIWTTADARFASHVQHVAWAVGLGIGRSVQTEGSSFQASKELHHLTLGMHYDPEALRVLAAHSTKAARLQTDARWTKWHGDGGSRRVMVGKVKSVESIGTMPTYDIEVGSSHWYYAGSVKSHNTVSLLFGVEGGLRFPTARYYARAVRIHDTSPLLDRLAAAGYRIEPDRCAPHTEVVYFPCESRGGRVAEDVSLAEQVELQATMQEVWSDNLVSVTNMVRREDRGQLPELLRRYEGRLKGFTALPLSGGTYAQAPYTAISEEEYHAMRARLRPLDLSNLGQTREASAAEKFCDGGVCAIA